MKKMLIAASAVGASIAGLILFLRKRGNVQKTLQAGDGEADPIMKNAIRNSKYSMG